MRRVGKPTSHEVTITFAGIRDAKAFIGWFLDGGGDEMFSDACEDTGEPSHPVARVRCGAFDWPGAHVQSRGDER